MPSLQIRDLPDDVYEALAYRAERSGRSLAQQALIELRARMPGGVRERVALLERVAERTPPAMRDLPTPEALIRRDRAR